MVLVFSGLKKCVEVGRILPTVPSAKPLGSYVGTVVSYLYASAPPLGFRGIREAYIGLNPPPPSSRFQELFSLCSKVHRLGNFQNFRAHFRFCVKPLHSGADLVLHCSGSGSAFGMWIQNELYGYHFKTC